MIPQARRVEGTEVLARVGNDVILAAEVMPAYYDELARALARIPEDALSAMPRDQVEREKKQLLALMIQGQVQTKLIYLDAKRTIPEESFTEFQKKFADLFVEKVLPDRMEKAGVASADEFDEKLRAMGSSLERMKRGFVQQAVVQNWLEGQVEEKPEVSHGEMLDYYHEHRDEYEKPARARWEMLSVRIPRYSDGRAAQAKLAQMGNQVLQGRSMAEVLAAQPKDGFECRGGVQGWVTEGGFDVVSETIEAGVFSLGVGQPSQIFREGDAYYIIRVIEREEPQVNLFAKDPEIQNEVREKLQKVRRGEQIQKYLARLKKQFPVWTALDDDVQLAEFRRRAKSARN